MSLVQEESGCCGGYGVWSTWCPRWQVVPGQACQVVEGLDRPLGMWLGKLTPGCPPQVHHAAGAGEK